MRVRTQSAMSVQRQARWGTKASIMSWRCFPHSVEWFTLISTLRCLRQHECTMQPLYHYCLFVSLHQQHIQLTSKIGFSHFHLKDGRHLVCLGFLIVKINFDKYMHIYLRGKNRELNISQDKVLSSLYLSQVHIQTGTRGFANWTMTLIYKPLLKTRMYLYI